LKENKSFEDLAKPTFYYMSMINDAMDIKWSGACTIKK